MGFSLLQSCCSFSSINSVFEEVCFRFRLLVSLPRIEKVPHHLDYISPAFHILFPPFFL